MLSCVQIFATPWTAARQASLSFSMSQTLLKFMSIESVMPSSQLTLCHLLLLLPPIVSIIRVFSMSHFFASGGQSIGASTSASVFPMNIQDRFPLGLTGLVSLIFKGLSGVFSRSSPAPQFESINPSALSLLYSTTLISVHDYWKNHSFHCTGLCQQSNVSSF